MGGREAEEGGIGIYTPSQNIGIAALGADYLAKVGENYPPPG
jgi:hypothetical protein